MVRSDRPVCCDAQAEGRRRDFNERYKEILDHYGLKATRTNSYSAHENGVAEQGHRRLKDAVAQALVLRGSSDFESVEQGTPSSSGVSWTGAYRLVREKLASEYPHLRALATRTGAGVRQLHRQGAQVEHHQGGQRTYERCRRG